MRALCSSSTDNLQKGAIEQLGGGTFQHFPNGPRMYKHFAPAWKFTGGTTTPRGRWGALCPRGGTAADYDLPACPAVDV